MTQDSLRLALTTVPDAGTGARLAERWVAQGWAACVNRVPGVISHYFWEGSTQMDREELLIVKTSIDGAVAIEADLESSHPYDCPEWVCFTPDQITEGYAAWWRHLVS